MALTSNRAVLDWIDEMAAMTQPDQIVWIDGGPGAPGGGGGGGVVRGGGD
mgnify:CR=1 FL=1